MRLSKEVIVGGVFILALVVLGVFIVVVGKFSAPWEPTFFLRAEFGTIEGLKKGDEVRLQGMAIGKIDKIEGPDARGMILITMKVNRRVHLFTAVQPAPAGGASGRDYEVMIKSVTPLGGRYVSIMPGAPGVAADTNHVLKGTVVGDPLAEAADFLREARILMAGVENGTGSVGEIVGNLRRISADLSKGNGALGRQLLGDEAIKQADELLASLSAVAQSARNMIPKLEKILNDYDAGSGTLKKLVSDPKLYDSVTDAVAKFSSAVSEINDVARQVKEGKGLIPRLITDEKFASDVQTTLTKIGSAADGLDKALSAMGRNENLGQDLGEAIKGLKELTQNLKSPNTTVGKLLTDKELYEKVDRLMTNVNQMIEDAREQAPVGLFASMLFMGL